MEPIIITGTVGTISTEDDGAAKIADLDDMVVSCEPNENVGFFVRLQSWNDNFDASDKPMHPVMDSLAGKKVRITVEVLPE